MNSIRDGLTRAGQPHHAGKAQQYLTDLEYMLNAGASFSIYMVHGGTTFGLWSGADRPFKPDTSSYDYDAPISEAGWPADKFYQTRDLLARHLLPGESLPETPAKNAIVTFSSHRNSGVRAGFCQPAKSRHRCPAADHGAI